MSADAPDSLVCLSCGRVGGLPDYPGGVANYSAHDVAAEIRRRLPGIPVKKLHKLLYYAQGHHLATFGAPIFAETISAWDMGPVVGQLWYSENQDGQASSVQPLNEAELNTIGYVLSRYGRLSGGELERLTHSETPWLEADAVRREHGSRTQRIEVGAMQAHFAAEPDAEDVSAPSPDPAAVKAWLSGARPDSVAERVYDSPESLLARLP